MNKRQLILEDGTIFVGDAFGSHSNSKGEVVFNTGMTGYQEVISDPSYYGHIVTMTYPSIGTYGINRDDFESISSSVKGVIVKEVSHDPSNFRSEETLDQFLKKHDIPGISGIDTRKLTRLLRQKGTVKGMISDLDVTYESVLSQLQKNEEKLLVEKTSITRPYIVPGRGKRIVVIDLGMKHSILHELTKKDCHVTVVPYDFRAEDILRFKPDGILISNGPGNPQVVETTIETIRSLLRIPLLGIGLGHQLFAIACGATTKKLNVGQYGTNYPVKDLQLDKTWITTQSRHYKVEESSVKNTELVVTFRSLHDGTIEGLAHKEHPAISVQFNPEGAPGSNETNYIFNQFLDMIEQCQLRNGGQSHA